MSELQAPCRNCGLRNEGGRDFCEQCGEYLSWAPTQQLQAVRIGELAEAADEDDGGSAVAGGGERDDAGRRASFVDDDDRADDVDEPGAAPADGDGSGDAGVAQAPPPEADEEAIEQPSPDGDEPAAELTPAADGAPSAVAPDPGAGSEAVAEEAPVADTPDAEASASTDAPDSPSAEPAAAKKRGKFGAKRRARPPAAEKSRPAAEKPRRVRPPWGRAAVPPPLPEAEAEAQARAETQPITPPPEGGTLAAPDTVAAATPAPAAETDAPPALPTPPAADVTEPAAPPPPAPPADFGDTAANLPPSDERDARPPPPPLEAPPPPVPLAQSAPIGLGQAPPASGDASIILTPEAFALGASGVPAVDTGATLSYNATIRNESRLVDNYELSVLGLPEGWSVVNPPTAFLVPLGSGRGESDTTVRIDISPPRDYRSTAGIWTFELIAMSRTTATVAGRAIAQFEVKPFPAWSVEAVPVVNSGRLKARYRVAVRNDGNGDQDLWLFALEDSGRLRTRFRAGALTLAPGSVGVDVLTLRPRLPLPVGRTKEHRVGVDAVDTAPEVDEDELSLKEKLAAQGKEKGKGEAAKLARGVKIGPRGVTVQKPRVPNPAQLVRTPGAEADADVQARHGDAPADAQRRRGGRPADRAPGRLSPEADHPAVVHRPAAAAGTHRGRDLPAAAQGGQGAAAHRRRERVRGGEATAQGRARPQPARAETGQLRRPVGSVIDQSPGESVKVEKGSAVSVVVAIPDGNAKVEVPHLKGLTRVEADKRLRDFDLLLGEAKPDDAGENFVVRSQIPAEDLSVAKGTAVRVFLEKPKPKAAKKKAGAKGGAGAWRSGRRRWRRRWRRWWRRGDEHQGAGLQGQERRRVHRGAQRPRPEGEGQPRDRLPARGHGPVGRRPKVGEEAKKGAAVKVRASGGPPTLAVQVGSKVRTFDTSGDTPKRAGHVPERRRLGQRSSTTRRRAIRSSTAAGRKIVVSGTSATPSRARSTPAPTTLEHPAFAPNGQTLAVIRREEGDGDLCFGMVEHRRPVRPALPARRRLGPRRAHLLARRRQGGPRAGPPREQPRRSSALRMYETERANTTAPELWRGSTATDSSTAGKGVLAGAFAPVRREGGRGLQPEVRRLRGVRRRRRGPQARGRRVDRRRRLRRRLERRREEHRRRPGGRGVQRRRRARCGSSRPASPTTSRRMAGSGSAPTYRPVK